MRIWPIFCLLTKFCALLTDYGLYQAHDTHEEQCHSVWMFCNVINGPHTVDLKRKNKGSISLVFLSDPCWRNQPQFFSNDQRFLQLGGWGGKANGWCWQLSRTTSWKVRGGGGMKNCNSWISLARKSFTRRPERALKVEPITNIWNNFQKLSPAETFTRRSERALKVEGVPKFSNGKTQLFLSPNNTKVLVQL